MATIAVFKLIDPKVVVTARKAGVANDGLAVPVSKTKSSRGGGRAGSCRQFAPAPEVNAERLAPQTFDRIHACELTLVGDAVFGSLSPLAL